MGLGWEDHPYSARLRKWSKLWSYCGDTWIPIEDSLDRISEMWMSFDITQRRKPRCKKGEMTYSRTVIQEGRSQERILFSWQPARFLPLDAVLGSPDKGLYEPLCAWLKPIVLQSFLYRPFHVVSSWRTGWIQQKPVTQEWSVQIPTRSWVCNQGLDDAGRGFSHRLPNLDNLPGCLPPTEPL